jgi:hypothetical protein
MLKIDKEIKKLVRYCWENEERDYWESDKRARRNHIFNTLRFINQCLHLGFKEDPDYREDV